MCEVAADQSISGTCEKARANMSCCKIRAPAAHHTIIANAKGSPAPHPLDDAPAERHHHAPRHARRAGEHFERGPRSCAKTRLYPARLWGRVSHRRLTYQALARQTALLTRSCNCSVGRTTESEREPNQQGRAAHMIDFHKDVQLLTQSRR